LSRGMATARKAAHGGEKVPTNVYAWRSHSMDPPNLDCTLNLRQSFFGDVAP
jgi:hypothetical protein